MRLMKNKGVTGILVALLMISGMFFMGTPNQEVMASEPASIKEDVLSVKCQVSDDMTKLRMVTTIDGVEQYKSLGFEIKFVADDDDPAKTKNHTVKTVFRKIDSKVEGVDYDFSTKVFHVESEWFATYTITGIPAAYQDNGIIIKPYVTIRGTGQKIYGQSRYLTMQDINVGVVSLAVKDQLTNPTVEDNEVVGTHYDGAYTHVRVNADYSKLPSISTYKVTDSGNEYTAKYRYLHSQVTSDTSWYTETEDGNKVIVTAGDLRGFQAISPESKYNGFTGETIYLGADIDLNLGWEAGATAPTNVWTPIGRSASGINAFSGTFDGQGHTIKGVYVNGSTDRLGFFGMTAGNAVVKDFTLENSYIKNSSSNPSTGSIVGRLGGTLESVKSSADVVLSGGEYSGGLVGDINSTVGATISNCWFAGSVSGTGSHHGQLLGGVRKVLTSDAVVTCTISNSLATGSIELRSNAGGLVGSLWTGSTITITDSLFAGSITKVDGVSASNNGTIIANATNGKATVTNTYAKEGTGVTTKIGNKGSNVDTGVTSLADSKLFGSQAFGNMAVDFFVKDINEEGIWFAMADSNPILTAFADKTNPVDLSTAQGTRTYWFDEENPKDSYTLCSPAELRGFQVLAADNNFYGIEIKLANDIDLNPGWEAGDTAPENVWTPIGRSADDTSVVIAFRGTFNGQGHTISGVYVNNSLQRSGLFATSAADAVIKDFTLENSYIYNSSSSASAIGSIVGRLGGTLEAVKSSAQVVVNGSQYAGGLVGDVHSAVGAEITNCWFAGVVQGDGQHHGGIIGGVRQITTGDTMNICTITNCLSTGEIDKRQSAGGICGTVWTNSSRLVVNDSLFAGTFVDVSASNTSYIGTIAGHTNNGTVTVSNVYASDDSGITAKIGYGNATAGNNVVILEEAKLNGSNAFGYMAVDFFVKDINEEGTWFAMADSAPILTSFADKTNPVDLSTAQGTRTYWFDAENPKESYTLCSPAELRGFQVLAADNNFYGIEIKLANDIDLNPDWVAGDTAPENVWTPVGRSADDTSVVIAFRGTFNGQGHTISGVYVNNSLQRSGLFATSAADAVIKDFTLENSYIYNSSSSASAIGSIVGRLGGTLEAVKSSAQVVVNGSQYAGGLVGDVHSAVGAEITNCWFAGVVAGDGQHHGGIIGGVRQITTGDTMNICTITNCLSTGEIDKRQSAGGICGTVWTNGSRLVVNDSLFAGTFVDVSASSTKYIGTIAGHTNNGTVTVSNAYCSDDSGITDKIGYGNATAGNSVVTLSRTGLTGASAYRKTLLGFYIPEENVDGKWVVFENSMPVLKSFAAEGFIDLTNIVRPDTSWYAKEPYVISTMEQLYGLADLSETTDFANKTITLAKDIVINESDASTWGTTAPKYEWVPIQNFAGTFDGGMNSISGIYLKSDETCLGLFKEVSGTVKNVVLENSYIESILTSGKNGIGSVVGRLAGTIQTVKSSADVVLNGSQYAGGLVGDVTTAGAKIDNCWFAGSVSGTGDHHGTLLGGLHETGATATITNCLSTGEIDYRANAGGIVGTLWDGGQLTLSDSLFAGTFVNVGVSAWNNGTAVANTNGSSGKATVSTTYVKAGSGVTAKIGNKGNNADTGITELSASDLNGVDGYMNTELEFYIPERNENGKWVAVEASTPMLKSFAGVGYIDLTDYIRPDTSWYATEPYQIGTMEQLYGLAELSKSNDFSGKTITLSKDIVINKGDAKTWGTTAPKYEWVPIQTFAGTFDGGMYSISGIYLKSDETCLGLFKEVSGTVKNVVLENSYIESTLTSGKNGIGSVVGRLAGTIQTVKSSADVVLNGSEYAGGLVGDVITAGAKIDNCWFAGSVSGLGSHHGTLLGGLHETGATATITNCLSTGTIEYRSNAGGLVGTLWNGGQLTMNQSLFAGTFIKIDGVSPSNNGTAIANAGNGVATVSAVYIKEGSGVYTKIGNKGSNVDTGVTNLADSKLNGNAPYGTMNVDFYEKDRNEDGVWFAMADSHPILTSFADTSNPVDLTTAQGTRTYWFDAENPQNSYTLYSPAELRGLQVLVAANNTFEGIEIKLGKDIDLNPGWKVSDGVAPNVWTPIGRSASDSNMYSFKGTFNGQGHTIKGVYVSSDSDRIGLFAATAQGSVVKDFTLENSVIYGTKTSSTGSVGSIVGRLGGTLDTVKSSADVILSGCEYAGGLVGDITTTGATITNCWFSGNMGGTGSHHAQLLGGVREGGNGYVTHCLADGTIAYKGNTGGLVGTLWGSSAVNISDCLFAGTFLDPTGSGTHGAVVGNSANGTVNVSKVYVQKGSGIDDAKIIGNAGTGTHNDGQKANVTYVEVKELYLDDARENTELTIYPQGQDSSSDGDNKQFWWYVSETHPVLASFGTPVSYDKMKVATYNIGSCIKLGTDNHESVRADVVSFIQDNNIDVCLLQEVDKDCERSDNVDQAKAIADALGYHYAYIATLEDHYSLTYGQVTSYGIAIVSRYEITSTNYEYLDFSGQNEKRAILKAMVDVNGTETAVICTHFDNAEDTTVRTNAVATLKTMIDGLDASTPVIFGGDLNQAYAGDETVAIKELGAFLTSVTKARYDAKTTMAGSTWYQLDYIFTNTLVEYGRAKVYTPTSKTLEGELSDHRPLVVNLYMNIQK